MRNLRTIRLEKCRGAVDITAACWDAAGDEMIVAFGPTADEPRVRLARVAEQADELNCHDVASWDALSPRPDMEADRIVGLHYFGDLATACVVMAGGDIVMAREDDGESGGVHIEIVGSVDAGIVAARWSPDDEVLALVTRGSGEEGGPGNRSLLLMSRGFEPIGETAMTAADLAASKHVSVGWGKKETQFRGRGAAKALRDPTIPQTVDSGTLSPADDGAAVTISWRGDGEYVAVNAVVEAEKETETEPGAGEGGEPARRRVIRVYNREGVLDSASEPVDGLEACLSWRPAGNLLAGVAAAGAVDRSVVFFERNGLRHGQFDLRPPAETIPASESTAPVALEWNVDSTVLAVVYPKAVQLWTMGNYHWYLKHEMAGEAGEPATQPAALAAWHPEKPLRLLVATTAGSLAVAEYVFATARGTLTPPLDHGAVAVLDGCSVLLTPMRAATVPPPMSLFSLAVRRPAVDVAFAPGDAALAVAHAAGVDFFSWPWPAAENSAQPSRPSRPPRPSLTASVDFANAASAGDSCFTPLQIAVLPGDDSTIICVLGLDKKSHSSISSVSPTLSIHTFSLSATTADKLVFVATAAVPRGSTLVAAQPAAQPGQLYVQDASGNISRLNLPDMASPPRLLSARLPGQLPWAELVHVVVAPASSQDDGVDGTYDDKNSDDDDSENNNTTALAVGLSRSGSLYANERLLAKNCTSFLATPDHLVFTTSSHLLKFVHLARAHELEVPLDDPETDERCRSIERGARLVTSVPSSLNVVLQMPRGNLETVFPRAMVVAGIRRLIDALDYARAFSFCRTQRVDMNILYDHRPAQFLAHVDLFLAQLQDVASIDLFLSSLRDEDVSQTMYRDTRSRTGVLATGSASTSLPLPPSKVNAVCDAVLASLLGAGSGRATTAERLQNVITAHVCKSPPALDDGLRVVAQLLRSGSASSASSASSAGKTEDAAATALAERAVEHICFLVDVNRLYDHALGLYDLGLAMAVAQQSQRDPREYVPFLQALHDASPEARRRFTIDDHLGRHEKALGHLQALGDTAFPELLAYVDRHRLYQPALRLYRYRGEGGVKEKGSPLALLTARYAAFLEAQSRFREAGLAHESLGGTLQHLAAAARCYQSAGVACWRECLFVAEQLQQLQEGKENEKAGVRQTADDGAVSEALREIATTLADALLESRDFAAAASVQLDYLGSVEAAVGSLCRGYEFAEAMRVAVRHGRADLLAKTVDGGLGEALSSSTELLADCRAQLRAQVPRILELRRKAAEDPLFYYEGAGGGEGGEGGAAVPDDVSVAASSRLSTGASLFTRYSTKTGLTGSTGRSGQTGQTGRTTESQQRARKKREDKKRARGRKGTVYELAYLVGSVRRLAERVERARGEVARLAAALLRRDMAERARAVESLMAELVEACQAAIAQVWPAGAAGRGAAGAAAAKEPLADGQAGDSEQLLLPLAEDGEAAPVMEAFQRLSLLG